jgi:hypothetical protein
LRDQYALELSACPMRVDLHPHPGRRRQEPAAGWVYIQRCVRPYFACHIGLASASGLRHHRQLAITFLWPLLPTSRRTISIHQCRPIPPILSISGRIPIKSTMFSSTRKYTEGSFSKHRASKSKSHKKNPSFRDSPRRVEKLAQHAQVQAQSPQSNQTSPTLGRSVCSRVSAWPVY